MMDFEMIFKKKDVALKNSLYCALKTYGYEDITNAPKFLYARGNHPVMLVAHLDTVHKKSPSVICYSEDGNYVMSPYGIGGDDRCGVYIILQLLDKLKFKPYVLFTMEEEIGGKGADAFVRYIGQDVPELNYIIEYDRKGGNDCVFYDCDNQDFTEFVESFGFKTAYGSFSDISTIAPHCGVAAVNISSGYYNPHTEHEYVSMKYIERIIKRSMKLLNSEPRKFEYVEAVKYYKNSNYISYQTRINAMILEPETVWVDNYKETHLNEKGEVAMDNFGYMYRKSKYADYYFSTEYIYPVETDLPPYDHTKAESISIIGF